MTEYPQMNELLAAIRKACRIILFSHISPDGDTLGSALALQIVMERIGKQTFLILDGTIPSALSFLPNCDRIQSPQGAAGLLTAIESSDLAIAVDVGSLSRLGEAELLFCSFSNTAQLDHHETNPRFAKINLVDQNAPATAVLVFRVLEELGLSLTEAEAICLYTAISTDTGNFIFHNTNEEAFELMSRLMKAGLPLARYGRLLFKEKKRIFMDLLGKALRTMVFLHDGDIAGMRITLEDMRSAGASNEHTNGMVDYIINIVGVKMAYFAHETEDGGVKFNLRALTPYRVQEVAAFFDGGGHALAAGCTVYLPLTEAEKKIQILLVNALGGKLVE